MGNEIRNGASKRRVVRLLGHADDTGAWEIRDFLKRSVVEFQWIELSPKRTVAASSACRTLRTSTCPSSNFPTERVYSVARRDCPRQSDVG